MTAGATNDTPAAARSVKPRDAATLIIVDRAGPAPRVLMGKRRMEQIFMPGKYVFPGGRVDKTDRLVASADELAERERDKLLLDMKGTVTPSRARALALAAIRETFEEAGLIIGAPIAEGEAPRNVPGWTDFFALGYRPRLSQLTFFARAITPPGRTRRYDTRFFHMDASYISHKIDTSDGELSGLHWMTMEDTRELDLPPITRVILEDLMDRIAGDRLHHDVDTVPYYHFINGTFRRDKLTIEQPKP